MGKLIIFPFAAMLAAAAPAIAGSPAPVNEIAPFDAQQAVGLSGGEKGTQAAEEKKICKQLETTGSRLPRRACLTSREWKQLQEELER